MESGGMENQEESESTSSWPSKPIANTGYMRRLSAFVLDTMFCYFLGFWLAVGFFSVFSSIYVGVYIFLPLVAWGYHTFFLLSPLQSTPGEYLNDIKLVSGTRGPISKYQATERSLSRVMGGDILPVLSVSWLVMLWLSRIEAIKGNLEPLFLGFIVLLLVFVCGASHWLFWLSNVLDKDYNSEWDLYAVKRHP